MRRVLKLMRRHFPDTHVLVRGDGHFSGLELMGLIDGMPNSDFIFGFSCNAKLQAMAVPTKRRACDRRVAKQTQDRRLRGGNMMSSNICRYAGPGTSRLLPA